MKKRSNNRLLILLALIVVVGALVLYLPSGTEAPAKEAEQTVKAERPSVEEATLINVDDNAPDFTVEMIGGEKISMADLRGKVVLVNFWATWCPPCREELKRVQSDIIDEFSERGLVFLPISRGEDKATVEAFLAENGYSFPVGLDVDQSIFKKFATDYIPRNFLINRQGVVVEASAGYDAAEFYELRKLINATLMAR